jgi:serine/threonine protein kinase
MMQTQSKPSSAAASPSKQKKMRTIGRWYIGETLGKGGYSWVKKGFDKKTGKCVALKFMAKADESWAKEQSKQVVTEIESLKQIRHPNVMKLYAYNLNARYPTKKNEKIDTVLLVLEFAPGGEIFDILYYTSALEPILARTYFRQSIFGLEACHNAGVAHRDIKPQNLLLDSRFNIKLTDFGLSKVFESDADAIMKTTYVGTRGYQAPELLLDKPYDLACDIFSMGVVLFILITGYPPFEQAHYSDRWFRPLAKGDCAKFWKYHAGCSISNDEKCKDLLEKMLCYDPKKRITIAEIKKHPWFNGKYLEGKELIRALRHRHREMEAKRRRDARKVKDLQVSITPNRSVTDPIVPVWDNEDLGIPEQVLSNCYCHYDMNNVKEFFQLLSGLIGNNYHGATEYEPKQGRMTCTISKMVKSANDQNAKPVQNNYKFEVSVYASKEYNDEKTLEEFREIQAKQLEVEKKDNNDDEDAADAAKESDENAHDNTKNKPIVLVVQTKRLEGDDYQFRKVQAKLLDDGLMIFNGLPESMVKDDKSEDKFNEILKTWDDAQDDNAADYENVNWNEE